MCFTTVVS